MGVVMNSKRAQVSTTLPWESRLSEVENLFSEQSSMLFALRVAMQEQDTKVGAFRQMLADKDTILRQLQGKLNHTEVSLGEQRAKVARLEREQDRVRQELRVKEATLETLAGRIHALAQQLIEQGNTLKHLETKHRSLVADKSEIEKLRGWVTELEPVAIQMQAQVLQQLQTEYQSAITDKDGEIERLRTRAAELQPLQDQIKQRDIRIRELVSSSRSLPGQEFHEPRLRDSLPKDHLTKIYGIGPVLEKTLNRLGYYRFRDIAAWSDTEVEAVARELSWFPDRIRRDKWVAQAQSLHRKKCDETP